MSGVAGGLIAERVTFGYGSNVLLRGVDVALAAGEVLGVLGPNGAGKSTLLKVLAGDLEPARGRVLLEGTDLRAMRALDQARLRAVMPQHAQLRFALTARQVVLLGRSPFDATSTRRENERLASDALALVDGLALAERPYPTLSGGEKQRIQLARALVQVMPVGAGGRYVLLDEPTANLDLEHQQMALSIARLLADDGIGTLAVLHDLNLAAQYCDRIAILRGGSVAACGAPEQVLSAETIERCFNVRVDVLRHPREPRRLMIAT